MDETYERAYKNATPSGNQKGQLITAPVQPGVPGPSYNGSTAGQTSTPDYSKDIQALYDAQKQAQITALEDAYNQNKLTLEQQKQGIAQQYNTQANDLATQFERTRRNTNIQAGLNGLNTGTRSQAALAQDSAYLNSFGHLRAQQAADENAAAQKIADLEVSYKGAVQQAIADNDYKKAAALLDEYKRRDEAAKEEQRYQQETAFNQQKYADQMAQQQFENQMANEKWSAQQQQYSDQMNMQQRENTLNEAKTRAAYGDFSGYAALYGDETAKAMQTYWTYNNPEYAYTLGLISADDYQKMTGKVISGTTGYGGGYSGKRTSSGNDSSENGKEGGEEGNTEEDAKKAMLDFIAERSKYGSDAEFYAARSGQEYAAAESKAQQDAISYGYIPGTPEYTNFIKYATQYYLPNTGHGSYHSAFEEQYEKDEADRQARRSEKEKEEAQDSWENSPLAKWLRGLDEKEVDYTGLNY